MNISKLNAIIFIFMFFEYIFLGIFVLFFLLITNNNQRKLLIITRICVEKRSREYTSCLAKGNKNL